jgi:hypothetical protein
MVLTASSARAAAPSSTPAGRPRPAACLASPLPGATVPAKPGSGDASRCSGVQVRSSSTAEGAVLWPAPPIRQPLHHRQLAGPDAHGLWRPPALRPHLLLRLSRASTSPATAAAATRTATTGSPAASMTVLNVSGHRLGTAEVESGPGRAPSSSPRPPSSAIRTTSRARASIAYVSLMAGDVRPTDIAAAGPELKGMGPSQGDRPLRRRPTSIQFALRPAQDPLRQDHAPHPAQDRRGRPRHRSATPPPSPIPPVVDDLVKNRHGA